MPRYLQELLNDDTRGWKRFYRTITLRSLRESGTDSESAETSSAPKTAAVPPDAMESKFRLPSKATGFAQLLRDRSRDTNAAGVQHLESYARHTFHLLQQRASQLPPTVRPNHTPLERLFLRSLMTNSSITCKPADKNLGLVLVDTAWYHAELTRMLSDRITYTVVRHDRLLTSRGKSVRKPYPMLLRVQELHTQLLKIAGQFQSILDDRLVRFLRCRQPVDSTKVPRIYLIIKVHKARLCGRPIVPCTNWATTPASVVVDHLLQQVLRDAQLRHLVKDTKSLIVDLEQIALHGQQTDCTLLTADIGSLYTNIDTAMGLKLVRQFLREQKVDLRLAECIMSLLEFVMQNAYLEYNNITYHQIDGTAMGTACAPTYANICVWMWERQVLAEFADSIFLYRRFLDDILCCISPLQADSFRVRMNQLHPKLHFEFVSHPTEAAFLDLHLFKGPRFRATGVFDLRVHQKSMNLYLYIPFTSFHTEAMKRSFIQTELMRYIRNCSSREDYLELKRIFFQRLRDRGYPGSFLAPLFNSIFYSDRRYFLHPSSQLMQHPDWNTLPPRSACLLRRREREEKAAVPQQTQESAQGNRLSSHCEPPVFVLPWTPLSAQLPIRQLLLRYWSELQCVDSTRPLPAPIMAYQSCPSIMSQLVFQKAAAHERLEARLRLSMASDRAQTRENAPPATRQTKLSFRAETISRPIHENSAASRLSSVQPAGADLHRVTSNRLPLPSSRPSSTPAIVIEQLP